MKMVSQNKFHSFLTFFFVERYKDAFNNIAKAVEMVKNENKNEEEREQKKSHDLKVKLGIDPCKLFSFQLSYFRF